MKKLTAGIFATLLTVVTVGVANADIASTAWVNSKIGEVNTGVDHKIEGVQQTVNSQAAEIAELDEQVLGLASEVENKLDTATASQTYATKTALDAKADASALTALETEVGKKLDSTTASNTYATKTALDNKLDKNLGTGKSGQILTVGSDGAITSSATIAQGKVTGLTAALNAKANASDLTTLQTEVDGKQDKLNTSQLSAVNSGITASKVSTYDGYNSKITTATNTANTAKTAADAATEAANAAKTAAETATSTADAAKSAADAATEAAQSAASSASSAVTSASKAIPKPADTEVNSDGVFVLTYNATNKEYAWERISR